MKRGLTIIELLISLGIFSGVMLGVSSWIQVTTRTNSLVEPVKWQRSAEAVLQLIHDDISSGDFQLNSKRNNRNKNPKVEANDNVLEIKTRSHAQGQQASPSIHRYSLDKFTNTLIRKAEYPRGRHDNRLLIGNVSDWLCIVNDDAQTLSVTILSENNHKITRSYRLP